MNGLFKGLNNLKDFLFIKLLDLKDLFMSLYDQGYLLVFFLIIFGILIYYILQLFIGLKLGTETIENFESKKKDRSVKV